MADDAFAHFFEDTGRRFAALGFAALFFMVTQITNRQLSIGDSGSYRLEARFENVGGLKPKAAVRSAGVLVGRDFPPFEQQYCRISIGTMEEMQRAVTVFKTVLASAATRPNARPVRTATAAVTSDAHCCRVLARRTRIRCRISSRGCRVGACCFRKGC